MASEHILAVHGFMDRGQALSDSRPFRVRCCALLEMALGDAGLAHVAQQLEVRAGFRVERSGYDGRISWPRFFETSSFRIVLTCLTLGLMRCRDEMSTRRGDDFAGMLRVVLAEENLAFRLDDDYGFRYSVDEDFAAQRAATLAGLDDPEVTVARMHYEAAFRAMNAPRDTREAVRLVFDAVEVVARRIVPATRNLHPQLARNQLLEATRAVMPGDVVQQDAWRFVFDSFAEWITAVNPYRHGQPGGGIPTDDFAVLAMSNGGAYLRLLCEVLKLKRSVPAQAIEAAAAIAAPTAAE